MISVSAIKQPNRGGTKPRTGPVVKTDIDPANIAFCTLLEWQLTGSDFQQFRYMKEGDTVAGSSVRVLFVYLIHPDDSGKVSYSYNPVNVLPVTEDIDATLDQIKQALGIAIYKCAMIYESLTPPGYPTKGFLLDRKRYKPTDGVGDCWINLLSITEVLAPDETEQQIVIANYHPQPVPPLEYRLKFESDPDFARRYKNATNHAAGDFANSFPPDDGSGDWFYQSIAATLDIPRRYALAGVKFTDLGDDPNPGLIFTMIHAGFPKPPASKWVETGEGAILGICPDMWRIGAPGVTRDQSRFPQFVIDTAQPHTFLAPPDNSRRDEGFSAWTDAYIDTFKQWKTDSDIYKPDDALARMPIMAANFYKQGFNRVDDWDQIKFDWYHLAKSSDNLDSLGGYTAPTETPAPSELLRKILLYLGSDPEITTMISLWPILPSDPKSGHTGIRTRVYKFDHDTYVRLSQIIPGNWMHVHGVSALSLAAMHSGMTPVVDFIFSTSAPLKTYLEALNDAVN